jgi:hypothetical protein
MLVIELRAVVAVVGALGALPPPPPPQALNKRQARPTSTRVPG